MLWRGSPVLIVHSDDDREVPFSQSVELVQALRHQGVAVEQMVVPNEVHVMLRAQAWLDFFAAADDFFDRRRAAAPPAPAP